MIKAVVFDIGGVLLRTQDYDYRRRWEAELGLQPGELEEIVFNSSVAQKAQLGVVSNEAMWEWIGSQLRVGDRLHSLRHDFWAGDTLDAALVEMIRRLRPRYQTAAISNATDALRDSLRDQLGIADAFDAIVISAEEGIMKPDSRIYQRALHLLQRRPEETVFVDDFVQNVQGARALGMAAIHFKPQINLRSKLHSFGIVVSE